VVKNVWRSGGCYPLQANKTARRTIRHSIKIIKCINITNNINITEDKWKGRRYRIHIIKTSVQNWESTQQDQMRRITWRVPLNHDNHQNCHNGKTTTIWNSRAQFIYSSTAKYGRIIKIKHSNIFEEQPNRPIQLGQGHNWTE
jgi:hypothetical protein